mgnify:CR=1 FL=1
MYQQAIVTLPITPRTSPKLGLMFIPFIMDILGKKIGTKRVLGLNVSGSKLFGQDVEKHAQGYINTNSWLGIIPDNVWRDDQKENIYWINMFFQQLQADGYVVKDNRAVLRCPCRVVEMLATADNMSRKKRLYEDVLGVMYCKICKSPVIKEIDTVYLFKIPHFQPIPGSIIPSFTHKEVLNLAERFSGTELLISRSRPSAISLWTGKTHVFLDVDFGWQLYLPILRRYGFDPFVLVGSQENLFGCYLMLLLQHLIDNESSTLVVPGYCRTKHLKDEAIMKTFQEWNHNAVRLYLASHVTFRKKELVMDTSLISLTNQVAQYGIRSKLQSPQQSLLESLDAFEGYVIRQLIVAARRSGEVPEQLAEIFT